MKTVIRATFLSAIFLSCNFNHPESPSCQIGTIFNSKNGTCTASPTCHSGMSLQNGICHGSPNVCPAGTSLNDGQCIASPTCPSGMSLQKGLCHGSPNVCPSRTSLSKDGQCSGTACQPGTLFVQGKCIRPLTTVHGFRPQGSQG